MQDNIRFASTGEDIRIWDYTSMTVVEQFNPHNSPDGVSSVCWSTNNRFLASASACGDKIAISSCKSKSVQLFTLAEGQKQTFLHLHSNFQYLVSGGLDNAVNIWELKSRRLHRSLKDHKDEVTCVRFNGNDGYLASGSTSGEIILHNVTTNLSSAPFGHGSTQPIRHLKYSALQKSLLGSVSDSGTVTLWDVNSQNACLIFNNTHTAPATEICFSPLNDLLLATVGLDKKIIFYDRASKKTLRIMETPSPLTAADFMPDGVTLTVGTSRGQLVQYDLRMLASPLRTVEAHKKPVQCIQFQHSSLYLKPGRSSASSAVHKRNSSKGNSVPGETQSSNLDKEFNSHASSGSLTRRLPATLSRGTDVKQDNAVTGVRRSTSLEVMPSKETDFSKNADFKILDGYGRSSLGDMFSPVRDENVILKPKEDLSAKDGLEYLSQFSNLSSMRRNPVGANSQPSFTSSAFSGTPIREEDENPDSQSKTRSHHRTPEPIDQSKQLKKLSLSNSEVGILRTPLSSSVNGSTETRERTGKQVPTPFMYDTPSNGISIANPTLTTAVAVGVADSLSEKIVDAIESDRSGAPLTAIQINFIKSMIQETVEDVREACHRDIVNLQVEMIKQFHMQLNEMHTLLQRYSVNEGLVSEIEKLREENKRLRMHY